MTLIAPKALSFLKALLNIPQKAEFTFSSLQTKFVCGVSVKAAVSHHVQPQVESAAALTGGEYLCRWSLVGFDVCFCVERDGRAKQKVSVLLELHS